MSLAERWVVLGVGTVRATWFTELARWSTAGVVPVEFVKCVSVDEVAARLRSGRTFSALLADARTPGLDRDLLAEASARGCAPVVVGDDTARWRDDAVAALPADFDRTQVLAALRQHARTVDEVSGPRAVDDGTRPGPWRGRLVGIVGGHGCGSSTLAMAVAQGLGRDPRRRSNIALVDLALDGHLGVLHDAREVVPALQELVEAHRGRPPGPTEIRSMLFANPARGYDLLLGLRRHHDWTTLRPKAVTAALQGLVQAYGLVVADADADVEGEERTGSVDVEERNLLARTVAAHADVIVAVGRPGVVGVHRLARAITDLLHAGVPGERVQPVVVGGPRRRRERAEVTAALGHLTVVPDGGRACASPTYVAARHRVDRLIHDGLPLPEALGRPAVRAIEAALERLEPRSDTHLAPVIAAPGTVGHWSPAEETAG